MGIVRSAAASLIRVKTPTAKPGPSDKHISHSSEDVFLPQETYPRHICVPPRNTRVHAGWGTARFLDPKITRLINHDIELELSALAEGESITSSKYPGVTFRRVPCITSLAEWKIEIRSADGHASSIEKRRGVGFVILESSGHDIFVKSNKRKAREQPIGFVGNIINSEEGMIIIKLATTARTIIARLRLKDSLEDFLSENKISIT